MKDLYIKDQNNNYIPIRLELVSNKDLADNLIVITVGNDKYEATEQELQLIRDSFIKSEVIIDAMKRSVAADLLILPHIIQIELLSKKDMLIKTMAVKVEKADNIDNLPEIKDEIKKHAGKDPMILPSHITLSEYREIKVISDNIKIRKQRNGGGIIK